MWEYIVSIAVGIGIIANLPQVWKLWSEKRTEGISLFTYSLWWFQTTIMTLHAIRIKDIFFFLNQFWQIVILTVMIALVLKYRRTK